jgi:hypothetical protein
VSDIFEIKTAQIEIKIGDKYFKLKDPKFVEKIGVKKDWDELKKVATSLDENDYLMKAYELNKKTVTMFIPEMTGEFIDNDLPSGALEVLMSKIMEITGNKFGAVIEKAEKK